MTLALSTSLREVRGIGPRRRESLAAAGILTVEDLLLTLPLRYEDRSRFLPISDLSAGVRATVTGRITSSLLRRTRVCGFTLLEIRVVDGSGSLACLWYNQPYLRNTLQEGREVVLFGEATRSEQGRRGIRMMNPQFEILGSDPERIHSGRIVPIYRRMGDLSTRGLRGIMHRLLGSLSAELPDPLPPDLTRRIGLPSRAEALRGVHFPPVGTDGSLLDRRLSPERRRLAFEELFRLQLEFARSRSGRETLRAIPCPLTPEISRLLERVLPFRLTGAQVRALGEITADLARPWPMGRLLQGDVGCGKTVVAFLAALVAVKNGCQAALMAPTEILAAQHFATLRRLLPETGCRTALLTRGVPGSSREAVLSDLARGEVDLAIGTHALIQDPVRFRRLGLVIVDEQHRFGVRQRARLREKGEAPHLLLMTATPIPRSLALALYGDLEISLIDVLPPGRAPVRTVVRAPADRPQIYAFIRREVARGRRAAVVYPVLKESSRSDLLSAREASKRLSEGPFRGLAVGLLHGRLSAQAKREVMEGFSAGRIPILVATTVLEVGIDVPEASIILVEHADRFGLSQLHQLRGRVGRGSGPSWCILMPGERASAQGGARLKILSQTGDGFEIAQRDLEFRGPGDLRGARQSGDPDLRVADLVLDRDLLEQARKEAIRIEAERAAGAVSSPGRCNPRRPSPPVMQF